MTISCEQVISQSLELNQALSKSQEISEDLMELCDQIGGRVTGSVSNKKAVDWAYAKFKEASIDVEKEAFEMPVLWLGEASNMYIDGMPFFHPQVVSKYNSPAGSFVAQLVDGGAGDSLCLLKIKDEIKGNIVLVESDLCLDIPGLFAEYAAAAQTEALAREFGARAVVFMSSRPRKLLYRFITSKTVENELPQLVMAREDAKRCLRLLRNGNSLTAKISIQANTGPSFTSHNVIGEIRGSTYPDEIVLVGAHIDSWALGTGANDNGCNVSMLIDIARKMKELGIQPKRTIRFALWNGEEQGYFGSWAYTRSHGGELDKHRMAMSIDIGSGAISGFFTNGRNDLFELANRVTSNLSYLGQMTNIDVPIVGTDNFDFMLEGVPNLVGNHLSASYGTNYHASSDTYDKVDLEALRKNAVIIANVLLSFANGEGAEWNLPRHSRSQIQSMFDANNLEYTMRMFNVWKPWTQGERGRK